MSNWLQFTKERFPLASHLTMILLFVGAHLVALKNVEFSTSWLQALVIFFSILTFFFKMRLYDEIKDYDLDVKINPTRPLPRGLVTVEGVKKGIKICIALEVGLFAFLGLPAFLTFVFAIGYSLLMYREFFIGEKIRPHLTTYAMSHTVVTIPMGLSIFAGVSGLYPWEMPQNLILFTVCSWFLFNIFEFGRKTFATDEERNQVESYSKIFGRIGAVALVVSMAAIALFLIFKVMNATSLPQLAVFVGLLAIGLLYALKNNGKMASLYRNFSSLYIVLFYVCYLCEAFFVQWIKGQPL